MTTPQIALIGYHCTPDKVFIRVPNERGRFVLTDKCVAYVACPYCKAAIGEPCFRESVSAFSCGKKQWSIQRNYRSGTHASRRTAIKKNTFPPAKPRVRAQDLKTTDPEDEDDT